MNKLLVLVVLLLFGCGKLQPQEDLSFEKYKGVPVDTVIANYSPGQVGAWLQQNIRYASDSGIGDEYRPAEDTLALGYGDCDDFARLAEWIFEQQGIKALVLELATETEAHAVCYTSLGIMSNYCWYDGYVPTSSVCETVYSKDAKIVVERNFYGTSW